MNTEQSLLYEKLDCFVISFLAGDEKGRERRSAGEAVVYDAAKNGTHLN